MADFDSKYVKCPYYRRSDPNRLCCEGLSERNTINLVFEDTKMESAYKQEYCCSLENYNNCMVCAMLNRKYGD